MKCYLISPCRFDCSLGNLAYYENDDHSRSFIGLDVAVGHNHVSYYLLQGSSGGSTMEVIIYYKDLLGDQPCKLLSTTRIFWGINHGSYYLLQGSSGGSTMEVTATYIKLHIFIYGRTVLCMYVRMCYCIDMM